MRFPTVLKMALLFAVPMVATTFATSAILANDLAGKDALTLELQQIAKDFSAVIDKRGGGAVAVSQFSPASEIKGGIGPRIQFVLAAELKALKLVIDPEEYRFEIVGRYAPYEDPQTKLQGHQVTAQLIERKTNVPLLELARFVFGAATGPAMGGLNTHTPPNADPRELSDEFKRAMKDPRADVHGTQVRSQPGSPFVVEILVKSGSSYQAKKIDTDSKGRPLVPIHKDEVYGVRLINNSSHEAAVDLQIDGINCFAFSDLKAQYWIVGPGKQIDVLGWHKTNTKTLEFKVVDFPETAAAKLNFKPSASIGLITACFSASWAKDAARPADEPELTGRGTGFGAEIEVKTEHVLRTIGQVRDTISIRYER